MQIVAKNVREAREKAGLSQEDLAYSAGIDRSYLWGVESGKRNLSVRMMARLADALGTTAAELVTKRRK